MGSVQGAHPPPAVPTSDALQAPAIEGDMVRSGSSDSNKYGQYMVPPDGPLEAPAARPAAPSAPPATAVGTVLNPVVVATSTDNTLTTGLKSARSFSVSSSSSGSDASSDKYRKGVIAVETVGEGSDSSCMTRCSTRMFNCGCCWCMTFDEQQLGSDSASKRSEAKPTRKVCFCNCCGQEVEGCTYQDCNPASCFLYGLFVECLGSCYCPGCCTCDSINECPSCSGCTYQDMRSCYGLANCESDCCFCLPSCCYNNAMASKGASQIEAVKRFTDRYPQYANH